MNGPRRAVIFDLDGTLLDTLQDLACSVNYALEQFGLRQRSVAEIRRFLGNGVRNLMGLSVPAGLSADQFERVLETFRAHYLLHCYDHTAPYPGVESVLQALKQRGYALAHCVKQGGRGGEGAEPAVFSRPYSSGHWGKRGNFEKTSSRHGAYRAARAWLYQRRGGLCGRFRSGSPDGP